MLLAMEDAAAIYEAGVGSSHHTYYDDLHDLHYQQQQQQLTHSRTSAYCSGWKTSSAEDRQHDTHQRPAAAQLTTCSHRTRHHALTAADSTTTTGLLASTDRAQLHDSTDVRLDNELIAVYNLAGKFLPHRL